jgi:isoamylase
MTESQLFTCLHCRTPASPDDLIAHAIVPTWEAAEGAPTPLGVTWVVAQQAWNVAIYSRHAERVTLLLFDDDVTHPAFSLELQPLKNKSGPIWHCRVPRLLCPDARYYAWHIDGPAPAAGFEWHTFDAEKVLLDPYAKAVYFPPGFNRDAARLPGSNMGHAPLGVLNECCCCDKSLSHEPIRHGSDLVIYEMHIRGFTRHPSSGIAENKRGTFAAVLEKIPHLTKLGVTAVELMPVFQFDPDDGNYWGYMPLNFFSPHHAYSTDPDHCAQRSEFRQMVSALHDAGIEVILDVVYNHTCEGDHRGPTYGFKGIDNSTYYMVTGEPHRPYANYSGTGNTLHMANRAVRQLIVDSLRYWVTEMGVDGFRFDLASVFTRNSDGSINIDDPPVFAQIAADPVLREVRLIAEPWDAGGAYQLGRVFPGVRWMQWNARYRDTLQQFVRGDGGMVPDLMTRVYGSSDLFPDERREAFRPFQSINYVTSHDGFTLYDLVSFNDKRNLANGHNNTDGHDDLSWNCGWEGDDRVPEDVRRLRRQQAKNIFCLLMLSNGTPMFRMGDEFLQTQSGNNNPYNQDNDTTWLDWRRLQSENDVFRFVSRMIAFRKSHSSLGRSRFWRDDIHWYGPSHSVDMNHESRAVAWCLHGQSVGDGDIYVMLNAGSTPVIFGIHEGSPGDWKRVIDTSLPSPHDISETEQSIIISGSSYNVAPRSCVVLIRYRT